jgi:hypothetical protein
MNFTRSLLLGVFAASELGRSIRINQEMDGTCGAASAFYEQCNIDIRAKTEEKGIGAENEAMVYDIFYEYDTFGAADWEELKADLEAELMW